MTYKYADLAASVTTSGGNYDVWVGWGILPEVGDRVKSIFSPKILPALIVKFPWRRLFQGCFHLIHPMGLVKLVMV